MILAPGVFLFLLLQMDSVDLSDPVEDLAMWKSESPTQSKFCPMTLGSPGVDFVQGTINS